MSSKHSMKYDQRESIWNTEQQCQQVMRWQASSIWWCIKKEDFFIFFIKSNSMHFLSNVWLPMAVGDCSPNSTTLCDLFPPGLWLLSFAPVCDTCSSASSRGTKCRTNCSNHISIILGFSPSLTNTMILNANYTQIDSINYIIPWCVIFYKAHSSHYSKR